MLSNKQIKFQIDKALSELLKQGGNNSAPSGNLVFEITIPGTAFHHSVAMGKACANSNALMTPAHQFHIASITKTMTSVLILQLWENGAFGSKGLDISLGELSVFTPEILKRLHCKNDVSYGSDITLRQLLSHTSGLKDPYSDDAKVTAAENKNQPAPGSIAARWQNEFEKLSSKDSSFDEYSAYIFKNWIPWDAANPDNPDAGMLNYYLNNLGDSPVAKPGEIYHYSDTGFVILALIAEKIGAKSYHQLLRDNIFDPLMMDSTYLAYANDPESDLWEKEISDCYAGSFPLVTGRFNFSFDWGGGGVVSTAGDLNRFLESLVNGKLFKSKQTLNEMFNWSTFPALGANVKIGLGIFSKVNQKNGTIIYGHDGAWGSVMFYEPNYGIYLSGTVNKLHGVRSGLIDELFRITIQACV